LTSQSIARVAVLMLLLTGSLIWPIDSKAGPPVMTDYTASPPFITSTTTPNILIIMDNSGSMEARACEATSCGVLPDGTTSTSVTFLNTTLYTGFFDSMKCYSYDATDKRFGETTTTKATLATACSATEWDGNFINWATFRRFDAVKKALHGGDCSGTTAPFYNATRAADGTCPPIGTPALITIKAQTKFMTTNSGHSTTAAIPSTGAGGYANRVPTSVTSGAPLNSPANIYIHLRGGDDGLQGTFCVDNDSTPPPPDGELCTGEDDEITDSSIKGAYYLRLVVPVEPRGVVQQAGPSARFGLQLFNTTDGGRLLTAIGARQSIDWGGSTVETFTDNTAAMIDSIDESYPKTWTPLGENLYQAATYVAQINSNFQASFGSQYLYSLAYSPAAAYGTAGIGSLGSGTTELKGITGSETCPSGYLANACGRDPYFFASNHTPAWASPAAQAVCCKTFVILFTDGEPTQDTGVPATLQDYAHSQHGLHCTGGNGTIHTPDGVCNTNAATPAATLMGEHKTDYLSSGSHYLDDVAYWAHTTDLRQATIPVINLAGHDIPGFQNITLYTFFAFGNIAGRGLLMQAAKLGGFEDKNGNNLPDLASEWDNMNNSTGEAGADGVPDNYFESSNVEDLQDRLLAAIQSILQQTASGSSASVLASSATGEGTAYQAYFYPTAADVSGQVKWTGYLHSLWVDGFGNTREDTDGDGKQIYQNDKIVVTRYDTGAGEVLVDRYDDANGDGKADSTSCSSCGGALRDLVPIWEAGKRLALTDSANRKVLTWVDTDNDGLVDTGEQMAFSTANSATLSPYILAGGSGAAPFTANNIINFIRGDQITGLRNRHLTVNGATKVWKLGDIVNSTPVIVGPPKERYDVIFGDSTYTTFFTQYKNRRMVAYVGANDGMLHALNGGFYHRGDDPNTSSATEHGWFTRTATDNSSGPLLGDELWGFIPYHLLPQLQWLTRANYGHTYYVDLKPKVTDVRIFTPDADHPNGWGTILIGGFRLGGSCKDCQAGNGKEIKFQISGNDRTFYSAYFVLDITNPEADPKLLWSLTDDLLQMTTSYPTVLRVNPLADAKTSNTNAKWFAMFGSGPTGYNGASSLDGQVYIVDLKVGPGISNGNVTKDSTGYNKSFIGDILSLDANLDYRADVTYFGTVADTGSTPKWEGKLFRLTTSASGAAPFGGSTTPSDWGNGNKPTWFLYDFSCSPSPSCSGPQKPGPMAAAPTVTLDDSLNVWVFIGTGRFYDSADKGNTESQYFFGVKDDTINGTCTQGSDKDCQQKDLVNVSAAVVCSTCASGTNQVTDPNNTGVTTLTGTATTTLQGLVASKEGWYTTLPTSGERALYSPTLLGGIVFFSTFVPSVGGACSGGTGSSSLYALFYMTGSAYKTSVVGTDTVGGNTNVKRSTALGAGVASQVGIHMGAQGTDSASGVTSRSKACTQMSTGALTCIQTQPALSAWSHYLSWIILQL
jgi:type IV pilus assembly protein PilY1